MTKHSDPVQQAFASVVLALQGEKGVTLGAQGKQGFGSTALQVNGKIFSMVASSGALVVKLPKQRVEELEVAGVGVKFNPGHGRLMKEWLSLNPTSTAQYPSLASEALQFVRAKQ
jgi:hypothetical protein